VSPDTVQLTMLFADIAGSTRLISELGDVAAQRVIGRCLEVMTEAVRTSGGTELERLGDGIVCSFASPDGAAAAAVAMLARAAAISSRGPLERPVRLRVGFAHGPVVETAQTPFGATVHLAARIAAAAKPGQILTNRETLAHLAPRWRSASRPYERRVLKGFPGEQELLEILSDAEVTMRPTREQPLRAESRTRAVELYHGAQMLRVDASHPRAEIGRDPACDLVVEGADVSRVHATVEWNRGRARLEDVSTNGTTVERDRGATVELHHESTTLTGSGRIRLGSDRSDSPAALLVYACKSE
jgi:adenylate cyclase